MVGVRRQIDPIKDLKVNIPAQVLGGFQNPGKQFRCKADIVQHLILLVVIDAAVLDADDGGRGAQLGSESRSQFHVTPSGNGNSRAERLGLGDRCLNPRRNNQLNAKHGLIKVQSDEPDWNT